MRRFFTYGLRPNTAVCCSHTRRYMSNGTTSRISRALMSVSDKTGLAGFAGVIQRSGVEIIATGGTADLLRNTQVPVVDVSEVTGFPEIMGGRVKTLHPLIHGGLLGRRGTDEKVMAENNIQPIDLVIVNLYPFAETVATPDCTLTDAIEKIDVGGPTMLRAAAKNHKSVTVVVDPEDYELVINEIKEQGNTSLETRQYLAHKAFHHTAAYDAAISAYLAKEFAPTTMEATQEREMFPDSLSLHFTKKQELRYGENPHQSASLYTTGDPASSSLAGARQLQGKPLSYNNLADSNGALNCVRSLDASLPACVIVKHATPCGVGQSESIADAYTKALATDPTSAFGGIIAFNYRMDKETALLVKKQFAEVVLAPEYDDDALEVLAKKKNVRVLLTGPRPVDATPEATFHSISGGVLLQTADEQLDDPSNFRVVSQRQPTEAEMVDCLFAWSVVKHVKSNAIVYAKDRQTLGVGTGQTSRVFSARIAALKAEEAGLSLSSAALASDAFFPFADGVEIAAAAGITAVIQPGGSMRDEEVIAAADRLGLAMIFTGTRHFRH